MDRAWKFVAENQKLIRWALFRHYEKRLAMLAFGSGRDAVNEVSLYLYKCIKSKPQLIKKYKASTIVVNGVRWCTLRFITKELNRRRGFERLCCVADKVEYCREETEFHPDFSEVLRQLTWREREVVRLRYGLERGFSLTYDECGQIFRVTRERVRQIEMRAIRRLQHPRLSKKLKTFVEVA